MNLMDMLSSEADPMFEPPMESILEQESKKTNGVVKQPDNGIYFFPTVLTKLQTDIMEYIINIMSPELLKELESNDQNKKARSLLEDESDNVQEELKFNEIIDFLYDQLEITTNNPSLLVDHFLPKKLLLSEINEHLVNMSGKFQFFNRLINNLVEKFHHSIKYQESPIYNILVIANSVKELELIEGLIIGKPLQYNNVSTVKLYGKNININDLNPPESPMSEIEMEYKRKRKHKNIKPDKKPILFLNLITSSQLYNNYTPLLNSGTQFKLIFSFDNNLDTDCPSLAMMRNSRQEMPSQPYQYYGQYGQYGQYPQYQEPTPAIPIIIPIPIFSINHYKMLNPPPETNPMFSENNELTDWKYQIINSFLVNRINLFDNIEDDEDNISEFFVGLFGKNMRAIDDWLISWDSINFPLPEIFTKYNERTILKFSDEKIIKSLNHSYLGGKIEKMEKFDYKGFKTKLADTLYNRLNQAKDEIAQMKVKIQTFKEAETKRQLDLDEHEEKIADNYKKLKRFNEDANFIEKKYTKIDEEHQKLMGTKLDLDSKFNTFETLSTVNLTDKVTEQDNLIRQLKEDEENLQEELNRLTKENDEARGEYQQVSTESITILNELKRWNGLNEKLETKLGLPGIKILPSLIKKDDKINHELLLKKLETENIALSKFLDNDLEKVIGERNNLLANTNQGSSTRSINRMSRGSTPM